MKKILAILFVLGALIIGLALGYKVSDQSFIKSDMKVVYINRDINEHSYIGLKDYLIKLNQEKAWEKIIRYQKYVKGIYGFSYDVNQYNIDPEVLIVDTGVYYIPGIFALNKYFDREDEYYKLKDEYNPFGKIDFYMKPYRGYFVFGTQIERIDRFLSDKGIQNSILVKMDKETNSNLGKFLFDYTGSKTQLNSGVYGQVLNFEAAKDGIVVDSKVFDDGIFSRFLREQPSDRKLRRYTGKDRVYISSSKLGEYIYSMIDAYNNQGVNNFRSILKLIGIDLEEFLSQIDGEIVLDTDGKGIIIPFKETKDLKKIFNFFGQSSEMNYGDNILKIEDNLLIIGKIPMKTENFEIKDDTFLYTDLRMDNYNFAFEKDARVKVEGRVDDDGYNLMFNVNKKGALNLIDIIENQWGVKLNDKTVQHIN